MLDAFITWLRAHSLAAWMVLTPLVLAVLRTRTPAQWVELGETIPRLQGLIRALRGAGLDPVQIAEGGLQLVTGRKIVDPRDAEIARLRGRLAEIEGARRETTAPPAPRPGERGSATLRALVAIVVLAVVCLPLGLLLCGCPRLPPVSGCDPGSTRCAGDRPEVCSATQRWTPVGDVTCASVGAVCVEGLTAHCAPRASDGGVR